MNKAFFSVTISLLFIHLRSTLHVTLCIYTCFYFRIHLYLPISIYVFLSTYFILSESNICNTLVFSILQNTYFITFTQFYYHLIYLHTATLFLLLILLDIRHTLTCVFQVLHLFFLFRETSNISCLPAAHICRAAEVVTALSGGRDAFSYAELPLCLSACLNLSLYPSISLCVVVAHVLPPQQTNNTPRY